MSTAVRHIIAMPGLGVPLVVGRDPRTGDEAFLVDPDATGQQVADECADYLAIANARARKIRAKGQRRALWLLLAVAAGLLFPSPLRPLYEAQGWLLRTAAAAGWVTIAALLGLALREHLGMRRLWNEG